MVSKKHWKRSIDQFVSQVRAIKSKEEITVKGCRFDILPGVFSPAISSDTLWFMEQIIDLVKGKSFLEIGAGAGITPCLVAKAGAAKVVATDINKKAVKNSQINALKHSLDISVRYGSLFDPIKSNEKFDVIFWNHPFYYQEDEIDSSDMVPHSVVDVGYRYLKAFFKEGKHFLTKQGFLLLGTSNVARINLLKKMARHEGYQISLLKKTIVPVFRGKKVKMDLRIYQLMLPKTLS